MTSILQQISDQVALVDTQVSAMERKWGVGRLRLLVSEPTRQRFDTAQEMWATACRDACKPPHPVHAMQRLAEVAAMMARAWATLDAEAVQAGAAAMVPEWWEVAPDDPSSPVICVARTLRDAHAVGALAKKEGRAVDVWSLDEVARVIRANGIVSAIKASFPGAIVTPTSRIRREGQEIEAANFGGEEIPEFGLPEGVEA
jgi:hypothetical protein